MPASLVGRFIVPAALYGASLIRTTHRPTLSNILST
jgi:hypothetical protein